MFHLVSSFPICIFQLFFFNNNINTIIQIDAACPLKSIMGYYTSLILKEVEAYMKQFKQKRKLSFNSLMKLKLFEANSASKMLKQFWSKPLHGLGCFEMSKQFWNKLDSEFNCFLIAFLKQQSRYKACFRYKGEAKEESGFWGIKRRKYNRK